MCQITKRRHVHVHRVVGQHEADALVLAERLAERLALAGVVGGDVVRADRRAQPAHAVRQARRREAHLRVAEALADLAQHVVAGHAQVLDVDDGVAAHEARVHGAEHAADLEGGIGQVGEEHGGSRPARRRCAP